MRTCSTAIKILVVPGLGNWGHEHWQTCWQQGMPDAVSVVQDEWGEPQLHEGPARFVATREACNGPVATVAHRALNSQTPLWRERCCSGRCWLFRVCS